MPLIYPKKARLPRLLLLWWSVWLLGSWMVSFGWAWSMDPSPTSQGMAVRQLLLLITLGLSVMWPVYRLSLRPPGAARLLALMDWLALIATLQVVLWPMRPLSNWTAGKIAVLDLTISAWALIIAGLIALALRSRTWRTRGLWMAGCVALVLAAPSCAIITQLIGGRSLDELPYWSPISDVWLISHRSMRTSTPVQWARFYIVGTSGVLLWVAIMLLPHQRPEPAPQIEAPGKATAKWTPEAR